MTFPATPARREPSQRSLLEPEANERILLFDGACNLCNGVVRFLVAHDAGGTIKFAAIQSPPGAALMKRSGFDPNDLTTFVFLDGRGIFVRGDAVVRIAKYLDWPWRALVLARFFPKTLRDLLYDCVGTNRYRLFGRESHCAIPSRELAERFVREPPPDQDDA